MAPRIKTRWKLRGGYKGTRYSGEEETWLLSLGVKPINIPVELQSIHTEIYRVFILSVNIYSLTITEILFYTSVIARADCTPLSFYLQGQDIRVE